MMTMKNAILAAALGLASLTFASAKTYNVALHASIKVGPAQLAAGTYTLSLNGPVAVFTNVDTGKRQMVLVHSTDSNVDYKRTAIELVDQSGSERIEAIELEDTNSKLEF